MKLIALFWITGALLISGCGATRQAPADVASSGHSANERLEVTEEYGPLVYRPPLDLGEATQHDWRPMHLVIANQFIPQEKPRIVNSPSESPWPLPARIGSRPEYLIDDGYAVPNDALHEAD